MIDAGDKARIVAVALNRSYIVKLYKDGLLVSGIVGDDITETPEPVWSWGEQKPRRPRKRREQKGDAS